MLLPAVSALLKESREGRGNLLGFEAVRHSTLLCSIPIQQWSCIPSTSSIGMVSSSSPVLDAFANSVVAECIYKRKYLPPGHKAPGSGLPASRPTSSAGSEADTGNTNVSEARPPSKALSAEDDAKLIFGTVFSLRNMVRKLGGVDDK